VTSPGSWTVRHDDVVVISDPFVAVLAEAVRERGALVVIAGADTVAAKEQKTAAGDPPWDEELGWSRLLGDIVRTGREEHVGGIVHARPAMAVR
jgi:hypothetical protein